MRTFAELAKVVRVHPRRTSDLGAEYLVAASTQTLWTGPDLSWRSFCKIASTVWQPQKQRRHLTRRSSTSRG